MLVSRSEEAVIVIMVLTDETVVQETSRPECVGMTEVTGTRHESRYLLHTGAVQTPCMSVRQGKHNDRWLLCETEVKA